jgi:4-hydroxy-tetrahydrodipicolinate synthase
MPVGPLRKPLNGLDSETLAKGVRLIRDLGLDRHYDYTVQDRLVQPA